jgi:hypothetical protein
VEEAARMDGSILSPDIKRSFIRRNKMKKVLGLVLFSLVLTVASFSQEQESAPAQGGSGQWYNSYAAGLKDNSFLINAGVGFGFSPHAYGSLSIPPITVGLDYKLPIALPITVGAAVSLAQYSFDFVGHNVSFTDIGIGLRGDWHFNFGVEKLDTYAGLTLGYVIDIVGPEEAKNIFTGYSYFLYGVHVGGRYFFTDLVGAYLELGYSGLQVASIGVTFKI